MTEHGLSRTGAVLALLDACKINTPQRLISVKEKIVSTHLGCVVALSFDKGRKWTIQRHRVTSHRPLVRRQQRLHKLPAGRPTFSIRS
jgi:hypothetical protein